VGRVATLQVLRKFKLTNDDPLPAAALMCNNDHAGRGDCKSTNAACV
jgi:hypothetical protein